jgi:hypothetical protein
MRRVLAKRKKKGLAIGERKSILRAKRRRIMETQIISACKRNNLLKKEKNSLKETKKNPSRYY